MNNQSLKLIDKPSSLVWVHPLPIWPEFAPGLDRCSKTYTLCNRGQEPVQIQDIRLDPGNDKRINIAGGSCFMGLILAPQDLCTVQIQINPKAIGEIKQTLLIAHSGQDLPLWCDLSIRVSEMAKSKRKMGYLVEDTKKMARQRREIEQDGHRRFARVNARSHPDPAAASQLAAEGQMQNNILQNPWLNSQRFDGIDPNLNPEPPLNSEAKREFDNERREQEMEKQLRLGNMPKMSSAPKPRGY